MARKGQFKKGGGRVGGSHSKRSGGSRKSKSRAIVVRQPAPIVIRSGGGHVTKHKKHHGGKRRHGDGSAGGFTQKLKLAAVAAGFGYTVGANAPHKLEFLDKLPTIKGIPQEALIGGFAYVFRRKHKVIDMISTVGFILAGAKVGQNEFKLSGYYDD